MTIKRRLAATAALPAAGLAVMAGALALTGQAAGAAPLGDGSAPADNGDPAAAAADRVQDVADAAAAVLDAATVLPAAELAPDRDAAEEDGPADLPAAAKFGSGVSHIASGQNAGILNGTQVVVPIQVDVNVCGNSVAVLGTASASCGDDDEEEPPPPVDEEPPPPTAQEEPPPMPLPTPVEDSEGGQPELPRTGVPVGSIAGLGGVLTAGGAAMQLAGARRGPRYVGRHRRRPSPS